MSAGAPVTAGTSDNLEAKFQLPRQDHTDWTDDTYLTQRKTIFYMLVQMTATPKVAGDKRVESYVSDATRLVMSNHTNLDATIQCFDWAWRAQKATQTLLRLQ